MRIKLDDKHYLNSDQYCFWITAEYTAERKNGTVYTAERRCSGYTRTFSECVDSFIEKTIGGSEIKRFTDLAKEVEKLKKTVKGWKVVVERGTNDA